jgi:hypothetical protein
MKEARYVRRLLKIRRLEQELRQGLTRPCSIHRDLQRLIDIITEEVMAAQARPSSGSSCTCHSVLVDCCPDRLRGVLDAGATRLGLHATGGAAGAVSSMIDHTLAETGCHARGHREAVPRGA